MKQVRSKPEPILNYAKVLLVIYLSVVLHICLSIYEWMEGIDFDYQNIPSRRFGGVD